MRPELYIIHCTGTPAGRKVSKEDVIGWHMNPAPIGNGWSKPGYRKLWHIDGSISDLIDWNNDDDLTWDEVTYGAKGHNRKAIHVCYVGGTRVDNIKIPEDTRTRAQEELMYADVITTIGYYPEIKIGGHYQLNSGKACPSFDVPRWLEENGIPEKNIFRPVGLRQVARSMIYDPFDIAFQAEYNAPSNW